MQDRVKRVGIEDLLQRFLILDISMIESEAIT